MHWQSIFCFLYKDLNARINKIKCGKPKFWSGSHSEPCMTQSSSEHKLIKQTLPVGNQLSYLLVNMSENRAPFQTHSLVLLTVDCIKSFHWESANWKDAPTSEKSVSSSTNLSLQCSFCLRLLECLWLFSWSYAEHRPVVFQPQKELPAFGYTHDCMTPPGEPKETTALATTSWML